MSLARPLFARPDFQAIAGDVLRPGGLDLTARALDLAGLAPGSLVLDLGCGPGATAALLAERGCRVLALDACRAFLSRAARPGVAPIAADAHRLPLADGSLDAVICECVLSLAADPARVLAEVARTLAPGGLLMLHDVYLRERPAPCGLGRIAPRAALIGSREHIDGTLRADATGPAEFAGSPGRAAPRVTCADKGPDKGCDRRGASCLAGARPRESLMADLDAAGLTALAFEDHSRALAELAGRLLFAGLPATALAGECAPDARPGYYVCLARKGRT